MPRQSYDRDRHYVLNDQGEPVVEPDLMAWARWYEESWPARRVDNTELGDVRVSTVFLALDHNHFGHGPPLLFETMIFGGPYADHCWRWTSRAEAVSGHDLIVAAVRDGRPPLNREAVTDA